MNVKELIEELQTYPDTLDIVVNGYEAGYNNVVRLNYLTIDTNINKQISAKRCKRPQGRVKRTKEDFKSKVNHF